MRSLLKMGGYDLDIDGFLSGTIALNPNGRRTGLAIKGKVEDGKVQGVPFDSADFDILVTSAFGISTSSRPLKKAAVSLLPKVKWI